ncbi:MarR family transcriptional regulator [Bacillus cereus]|uniref:MarR family transcriptional regulator n=1 Tax=Bacillus fungorum TaxID=2039284 RepID=A0A2G6Q7J6_9BACI|nr:MarR family transcriptional regulator [Bacillus fungorum]MDA2637498.1 MarR family transcriptional regulator [Bacillus cereus]PIE92793.1 MarR family transcriptional regulator [Bacillus fungorum]
MEIYKLNISHKAKFFLYTLREMKEMEKTYSDLSDLLAINRSLIPGVIKELEENKLITVERGKGKKPSIYRINF